MSSLKYFILPKELQSRLQSTSKMERSIATLESYLNEKSQHHPTYLLKYSKFNQQSKLVDVKKGQYLTSYIKLAEELEMSVKQIRGRLEKLIKSGLVIKEIVKDDNGFDLGLKITYNPIFNMFNKGNRKKQVNPALRGQGLKKRATINKKVLSKDKQTVVDSLIAKRLGDLKCSSRIINTLLSKYTLKEISEYLDLLSMSKDITNPVAWLQAALKQKYDLTKLKAKKDSDKEKAERIKSEKQKLKKERQTKVLQEKQERETVKQIKVWIKGNENELPTLVQKIVSALHDESKIIFKSLVNKKRELGVSWIEFMSHNSMFKSLVYTKIADIIELKTPTLAHA